MRKNKAYITFCCLVASLGGLLFGLDQGLMNGSLSYIQQDLHLSTPSAGTFASLMLYGALAGSLLSGFANRWLGRKKMLVISAMSFVAFSFLSSLTYSLIWLSIYRVILGINVGIASFTVPLYISETAPFKQRGGLVSLYQLMITIGIFVIFCTNKLTISLAGTWHQMFYPITLTAAIMVLCAFFIPESTRWLLLKNRPQQALDTLKKLRPNNDTANDEFESIKKTLHSHSTIRLILKNKHFIKTLLLGMGLQFLVQLSGINAIIYYSSTLFHEAGITNPDTATIILGLINVLFTMVAILFADKCGRKPILYTGAILMMLSLLGMAILFHLQATQITSLPESIKFIGLACILIYIAAFAASAGPLPWVICSEIYPLTGREIGMTLSTATNWITAALVVQFSLPMMTTNNQPNLIGSSHLFYLFALACFILILVTYFFTPETKGTSLENLENNLFSGKKLKHIGS